MNYFIRTSPAWKFSKFLSTFDDMNHSGINLKGSAGKQLLDSSILTYIAGWCRHPSTAYCFAIFFPRFHIRLYDNRLHRSDEPHISQMYESLQECHVLNNSIPTTAHQKNWDYINTSCIIKDNLVFFRTTRYCQI